MLQGARTIRGPTPEDAERRSTGSPRSDGVSEVRSKESSGLRTPGVAREPAEASGRSEPFRCRMIRKSGCHGVSRDALARIFEIIIVNCRHRSIRIGVTNGPETAGSSQKEPLSSPEPSTAMRGCEVTKLVGARTE